MDVPGTMAVTVGTLPVTAVTQTVPNDTIGMRSVDRLDRVGIDLEFKRVLLSILLATTCT